MADHPFAASLESTKRFFLKGISCFEEADSGFAPQPGLFTISQHVAHTAQTIEWFFEGAFRPEGFSLDFAGLEQQVRKVNSLADAKAWFNRAADAGIALLNSKTMAEMQAPIAAGPIMGGMPRVVLLDAITDHTAHHRGALAVYARLVGKKPEMPYV